jgi:hypothetical protein
MSSEPLSESPDRHSAFNPRVASVYEVRSEPTSGAPRLATRCSRSREGSQAQRGRNARARCGRWFAVAAVAVEHPSEVSIVQDQETVGALRPSSAYPALGDGVRIRRPRRTPNDAGTFPLPHRVEARTELPSRSRSRHRTVTTPSRRSPPRSPSTRCLEGQRHQRQNSARSRVGERPELGTETVGVTRSAKAT